jgi:hypothetical protein
MRRPGRRRGAQGAIGDRLARWHAVVPDGGGEGQDLRGDAGGHAGEAASAMKSEVEPVVLEATGDDWKPPFSPLQDEFRCWPLDATQEHLLGRPTTGGEDVIWLAQVAERAMAPPSFLPPKPIRQWRDLTRYRRVLIQVRPRGKRWLEKTLEDARITLGAVIAEVHGVCRIAWDAADSCRGGGRRRARIGRVDPDPGARLHLSAAGVRDGPSPHPGIRVRPVCLG